MILGCLPADLASTGSSQPTPPARKVSLQSVLFAVDEGAVRTGSAAFLTQIVARLAVGPSARAVERHLARDPSAQAA